MAELIQIDSTTFSATDIGDVKPIVTIGGNDKAKFVPNLNASFFGDEFYFNLNRRDKQGVNGNGKAEITGDDTDIFHVDDNGRLKWDIEWSSAEKLPKNLTLEFEMTCSPGLEFLYQPSLEDEWKATPEGTLEDWLKYNNRPDDVVGSYAVYCSKQHNKYKTGKICHIYRPFVVDENKNKYWCTLRISAGKLTITLPDEVREIKGKLRLDPTIGYTSIGATEVDHRASTVQLAQMYASTMAEDGTAYRSYHYLRAISADVTIHGGYMGDNGTNAYGVIVGNVDITVSGTTPAWYYAAISGALSNGSKYHAARAHYLAFIYGYRDSGSSGDTNYNSSMANDTMIDGPLTNSSSSRYSMYLEYTTGGASPAGLIIPGKCLHSLTQGRIIQ